MIPPHAFLSAYGDTWNCERTYRRQGEGCVEIKVPKNGYLTNASHGAGWECERGYRESEGVCVAVKVPENAYFVDSSYGDGWKCERGYHLENGACAVVQMPQNAHLDRTGNDWECNPPLMRQMNICLQP